MKARLAIPRFPAQDIETCDVKTTMDKNLVDGVHCWWCCHPPDARVCPVQSTPLYPPVPLAVGLRVGAPPECVMRWVVRGFFCSWRCALAYARDARGIPHDTIQLTRLLALKYSQIPMSEPIVSAPPRSLLRLFGGQMDICEFRATSRRFHPQCNILIFSVNKDQAVADARSVLPPPQPKTLMPPLKQQNVLRGMPRNIDSRRRRAPVQYDKKDIFKHRGSSPQNIVALLRPPAAQDPERTVQIKNATPQSKPRAPPQPRGAPKCMLAPQKTIAKKNVKLSSQINANKP